MEAQGCSEMWLSDAMDFLWFDQTILSKNRPNLVSQTTSQSPNFSLQKSFSHISSPAPSPHEVDGSSEESDHDDHQEIRRLRLNHHSRCDSSSPTWAKKGSRILEKTMSLGDLEIEEVKGFLDLGFIFKRENLSMRTMRLIPGLRRLISANYEINDDEEEVIMRPYLSEAWVVKRPHCYYCPLMRIGGDCSSSDMKKNLKCWARNVALTLHREC